jgi:glycosyltransferase involved in cell wall biosynthesis
VKILQLVQKPQRRGAEVFAYQQSAAMRALGHTVQTAYLYHHAGESMLEPAPGDFMLAGNENHWQEKLPSVNLALLRKLNQAIADFKPHVVQVNGARTIKYGAVARKLWTGQPWALIYRNIGNPKDWLRGSTQRFYYRRLIMPQVDGIVGVSQETLGNVKDFYKLEIPMRRIPNGVEIRDDVAIDRGAIRDLTRTPQASPVILFVGSLSVEKRVDRLLRVAARVREQMPELHLWILGGGPQRQQLEEQAVALGLADIVRFLGVQPDVASYMAAADLFLLASDTEGIPAVILEAGAQGLPVIATRVGGTPECIVNNETGLLVDKEDEVGLASAVLSVLQDPARSHALGLQAKKWIRANFDIEKIAQKYLAFYQQVLARRYTSV